MGQARTCCVLHRVWLWSGSVACRSRPSSSHAALVEYLPVHGKPCHHHATSLSHQRDPAKVQETPELFVGAEPHGEELSAGDSRRSPAQLRQLCHMLGENGHGQKAAVLASLPQLVSAVVARARHVVSHMPTGAKCAKQRKNAAKSPAKHRFWWAGAVDWWWRECWRSRCWKRIRAQQSFFPLQWAGKLLRIIWNILENQLKLLFSLFSAIFLGCRTLASKFPTSIQFSETVI